jgi:hypothetical protein
MHIISEGIVLKGESGVRVIFTEIVHTVWEKNWPWIVAYLITQLVLATVSYWTNAWISVGWSIFGSAVSTFIGLFIAYKVITRTKA